MLVDLFKIRETNTLVDYRFEVGEQRTILVDGKKQVERIVMSGFCTFNKIDETFEIDTGKTDPYFFRFSRPTSEVIAVKARLMNIKRKNLQYSDHIIIATG